MWAHEWTRARQRSIRHEDTTSSPGRAEPPTAVEPTGESEKTLEQPSSTPDPSTLAGPIEESRVTVDEAATPEVDAPTSAITAEPVALPEPPPPSPAPPATQPRQRSRRRTSRPTARQAELPLGLEPTPEPPTRRSVTETREELIERLLDPHLTLQETAKLLDVCPTTIRRYTNRGLLAHYRTPGNQRRFRLSDVLAFMERQGISARGLERRRTGLLEESPETVEPDS